MPIEGTNRHRTGLRIGVAILGALFGARLGVVAWGISRGFDLGDGGFFLLNLNHPESAPPLFEFYRLLTLFDSPPRFDVVGARWLRLATEAVATALLAAGALVWARSRLPGAVTRGGAGILLFALTGSLLGVGAREFGYNDATNLMTYAACAALLFALALPAGATAWRARVGWGLVCGFALGVQLFVKFPPAILLGAALPALALVSMGGGLRERAGFVAAGAAGAGVAILCFALAGGGPATWAAKLELAREVNRLTGYGIGRILAVYVHHDIGSHVNLLAMTVAFAAVLGVAWSRLRARPGGLDTSLAIALAAAALVLAAGAWSYHADNIHPTLIVLFCSALFSTGLGLVLAGAATPEALRWWREVLPVLLLLALLPFVNIVGTNVPLTLRLPTHAFPILLGLALLAIPLRGRFPRTAAAGAVLLVLATTAAFFEHHWMRPYGIAGPLHTQTEPLERVPGLKVDPATRDFLEDLAARMQAAGFEPGDPVVALDFMPGLVHYLDARSPGFPFYGFDAIALNCWALNRSPTDEPPFLILGQPMLREQHACIRSFDFPAQFERVATLRNPYEQAIRYFFGGPTLSWVEVFGPASAR
ncbi:MAG: hypothetical protein ACQGVK_17605 [Myxococcota bacterium]